ncbi:family 16 glycosylhydrolase [Pseudomarimonas salicorniae]|uniref:Family 16 glycosylhydrolase n=1 Tax=Pseudomarimonas salicorniae TaxID=2933270 RepID=A0ABT0GGQ8_9GAMM|nr:family 16 glycosylhydrolase [Lysobacter sp. CAU 1642]MCK7593725.1 family 16 glycosylhydrolase [Lysobacter sp. CAU 1642]
MNGNTDRSGAPRRAAGWRATALGPALAMLSGSVFGQVLWSEEFNTGSAPDPVIWTHDLGAGGWGNSELQTYTDAPENARVEGGQLIITARETVSRGGRRSFTSARIKTQDKLTFKYATIEARIQVPNLRDGLWPAFWTLGNNFSQVGWPDCGEIDVLEMGSAAAIAAGLTNRRVQSTAHWEHNNGYAGYGLHRDMPTDLNGGFHVYRLEWTPDSLSTYIDGQWIWTMDIRPSACTDCEEFHQPHFLLLNMAVGGSFTGLYRANEITAPFPAEYRIDYIRVIDNGHTVLGGSAVSGGGSSSAHISAITPSVSGGGPNKRAVAAITVRDELGAPVSGASLTASFSGSHNEVVSGATDASGIAHLSTTVKNSTAAFKVCVDALSKPGLTYQPTQNIETCDVY